MKFGLLSKILPWRPSLFNHQNNRNLNRGVLRLLSKFGVYSFNQWWLIVGTSTKWIKFDLWKSRSITSQTIVILTMAFCTSGPNLVIIILMSDELSHRKTDWCLHTHMDKQMQAMTEGQNWSWVKMIEIYFFVCVFHELTSAQGLTWLLISVWSAVTSWQFVSWNLLVDGDSLLSSNHGVIWQACSEYCFSNSGTWMTEAAITVNLPWDLVGMLNY